MKIIVKVNPTFRIGSVLASAALCTLLTLPAFAQAPAAHDHHAGGSTPASGEMGGNELMAGKDMMGVMKESQEHMGSMPMTGEPDIDFAMMMRMHHLAAIRMAEIEVRDGKDAKTRDMARKIIASQKKEVHEFDNFLARHGHPVDKGK